MTAAENLHWTHQVVGLPYEPKARGPRSVDCWGLMVLGARIGGGLVYPSYDQDYASAEDYREIDAVVRRAAASPLWEPLATSDAREFDVLTFRRGRWDRHVGMFIRPGVMLHIEGPGTRSVLANYRHPDWADVLTGCYRFSGGGR